MPDKPDTAEPDTTQPRSCAGGADSLIELKPCALGVTIWFHQTSAQTTITERELRDLYQVIGSHFAGGAVSEAEVEAAARVLCWMACSSYRCVANKGDCMAWTGYKREARAALEAAAKVRKER